MKRPWPLSLALATVLFVLSRAALAGDFTLVLTPAAADLRFLAQRSQIVTAKSKITATGTFTGDIKILTVLPPSGIAGIKALSTPTAFYPGGGGYVDLSINVDPSVPDGSYAIVVTAIGCVTSQNCSGPTRTASFMLKVSTTRRGTPVLRTFVPQVPK